MAARATAAARGAPPRGWDRERGQLPREMGRLGVIPGVLREAGRTRGEWVRTPRPTLQKPTGQSDASRGIPPLVQKEASGPRRRNENEQGPRIRKRPDAIMVTVTYPETYLDVYRTLMVEGKPALRGVSAVKRTRLGHILLELVKGTDAEAMANDLTKVTGGKITVGALQDKTALEIRDVCPLTEAADLAGDLGQALKLDPKMIRVRTIRMGPMGTQLAVVEVPTNALGKAVDGLKFRSGTMMARVRPSARAPDVTSAIRLDIWQGIVAWSLKEERGAEGVVRMVTRLKTGLISQSV